MRRDDCLCDCVYVCLFVNRDAEISVWIGLLYQTEQRNEQAFYDVRSSQIVIQNHTRTLSLSFVLNGHLSKTPSAYANDLKMTALEYDSYVYYDTMLLEPPTRSVHPTFSLKNPFILIKIFLFIHNFQFQILYVH